MEKLQEPIGTHSFEVKQLHNKINELIDYCERLERAVRFLSKNDAETAEHKTNIIETIFNK